MSLSHANLQVYEAHVRFHANLHGLSYFVYHYYYVALVFLTSTLYICLLAGCFFAVLVSIGYWWAVISAESSIPPPPPPPPLPSQSKIFKRLNQETTSSENEQDLQLGSASGASSDNEVIARAVTPALVLRKRAVSTMGAIEADSGRPLMLIVD